MSYILDALKKMEQEKNMKAAPKEKINLSGALLKEDTIPKSRKNKNGRLLAVIVIALIAASGTGWYFVGKSSNVAVTAAPGKDGKVPPVAQQPQQSEIISAKPGSVPPSASANLQPAQAASPAPQVVPSPTSPGSQSLTPAAASAAAKRPVAPAQVAQEEGEEETRPARRKRASINIGNSNIASNDPVAPPTQVAQPTTSSAASVEPTSAAPANIKVSGIAWQDERSARRAVINDLLMKEGNVVSGAKILEIRRDRVRFSLSGSTFEVPLLSSTAAPSSAGK